MTNFTRGRSGTLQADNPYRMHLEEAFAHSLVPIVLNASLMLINQSMKLDKETARVIIRDTKPQTQPQTSQATPSLADTRKAVPNQRATPSRTLERISKGSKIRRALVLPTGQPVDLISLRKLLQANPSTPFMDVWERYKKDLMLPKPQEAPTKTATPIAPVSLQRPVMQPPPATTLAKPQQPPRSSVDEQIRKWKESQNLTPQPSQGAQMLRTFQDMSPGALGNMMPIVRTTPPTIETTPAPLLRAPAHVQPNRCLSFSPVSVPSKEVCVAGKQLLQTPARALDNPGIPNMPTVAPYTFIRPNMNIETTANTNSALAPATTTLSTTTTTTSAAPSTPERILPKPETSVTQYNTRSQREKLPQDDKNRQVNTRKATPSRKKTVS